MPKQLNVNLQFTADTTQARQQLKQLQQDLSKITTSANPTASGMQFTDQLNKATDAATRLQAILKSATNVETGNLDLRKFNEGLKSSGMTLKDYRDQLVSLGPQGQAAFAALTTSIQNAEMPARRINGYLEQLKVSLANTARWQISSSILHGFMSSVSHAYNYAQELNKSLNDIRIVTGYNTDQMAEFAETANKAARALSTTTTEYTNASLIYYQQGLSDQEVQQRTDVTIKMANAAGVSAQTVSDQLTAVWNNFYDGSKSLEYYADVMVRLGADTASSTDEISDGLNKFAAVADTVGLSYEYAASALATITATTRQSADVVGTALRTLFARIQGLSLGETLDDGTNLNKYSKALASVGIDIKTQNGELKDMDQILSEMGDKWETLSKDQQVALAQTVAGVRQYNQLLSLMDNWDYFEENLERAYGATGSLDEQQEIYAEGWEAAQKRVSAAAEAIYADLFDDEAFIKVTDALGGILEYIGNVIDALGGFGGAISLIGSIGMKVFGADLVKSITNVGKIIKDNITGESQKTAIDLKTGSSQLLANLYADTATDSQGDNLSALQSAQGKLQLSLIQNADKLTEADQQRAQILLEQNNQLSNIITKTQQAIELQNKANTETRKSLNPSLEHSLVTSKELDSLRAAGATSAYTESLGNILQQAGSKVESTKFSKSGLNYLLDQLGGENTNLSFLDEKEANEFRIQIKKIQEDIDSARVSADGMLDGADEDVKEIIKQLKSVQTELDNAAKVTISNVHEKIDSTDDKNKLTEAEKKKIRDYANSEVDIGKNTATTNIATKAAAENVERLADGFDKTIPKAQSLENRIAAVGNVVSTVSMAFFGLQGIFDTIQNDDLSFWEKLFAIFSSGAVILPSIITSFNDLQKAFKTVATAQSLVVAATKQKTVAELADAGATIVSTGAQKDKNNALREGDAATDSYVQETREKIATEAADTVLPDGSSTKKGITSNLKNIGTQATSGLKKIGKFLGTTLGKVVGVAMVAAITTALYSALDNANVANKTEEAYQNAVEGATAASDAAAEANAEYTGLKDTIDSYNNARSSMDSLTEGTQAFKDATLEANEAARELIDTYGIIGKYNAETGTYDFTDEQLEEAEKAAEERANATKIADISADSNVLRAENAKNIGNLTDDNNNNAEILGGAIGAAAGIIIGTALLGPLGAIGYAISAGLGILASKAAINVTDQQEADALTALSEAYNSNGGNFEKAFNSLDGGQQRLIDSLGKTDTELEALCAELKVNSDAIKEQNKEAVDAAFSGNEVYANSKYQNELNAALAATYGNLADNLYENKYVDKGKMGGGLSDATIQEMYAEEMGYTSSKNLGDNMGEYTTAEGETVKISDEQARRYLAEKEALDQLEVSVEEYNTALTETVQLGDNIADGLGNALLSMAGGGGSDFSEATSAQMEALQKKLDSGAEEIVAKWKEMGYASEEEYFNALKAGVDGFKDAMEEYQNTLDGLDLNVDLSKFGELTRGQAEAITNTMVSAFESGGRELTNLINNVLLQAGEDAGRLAEIIEGIDWTDPSAVIQLTNAVKEEGLAVDTTSAAFLAMANSMQQAAIKSLSLESRIDSLRNALAELRGILGDLDFGSVISDEDFNKLMEYDSGVRNMFLMTPEGYQFIGNQGDLDYIKDIQKEATVSGIREQYSANRTAGNVLTAEGSNINWNDATAAYYTEGTDINRANAFSAMLGVGETTYSKYYSGATGYSYDALLKAQQDVQNIGAIDEANRTEADQAAYDAANAILEAAFNNVDAFIADYQTGVFDKPNENRDAGEILASDVGSISELQGLLNSGDIDQATYNKTLPLLQQQSAENLGVDQEVYQGIRSELEDSFTDDQIDRIESTGENLDTLTEDLIKQQNALEDLSEQWEDYEKILKSENKESTKYQKALSEVRTQLTAITGLDFSNFDGDFFVENADLISEALNGSQEALTQFQGEALSYKIAVDLDYDSIQDLSPELQSAIQNYVTNAPKVEIGTYLKDDEFATSLFNMLTEAGMTVTEIQSIFNELGWAPEVTTTKVPVTEIRDAVAAGKKVDVIDPTTGETVPVYGTDTIDAYVVNGEVEIPVIGPNSVKVRDGGSVAVNTRTPSSTGGGGGGSSKPKKAEKPKKSDVVERYKELNDTIDDLTDAINDASKASDRLYGRSRIQAIQQENDLLLQQIDVLKQKKAAAEANLATDRQALNIAAQQAGVSFTYDENGNISNYTSQMTALYNQLSATIDAANADGNATEEEQEQIDKLQELIDELTDAIGQYDETKELIQDLDNEITDAFYQWQDNNYEILHYELEIEITLNDLALEKIDYYLNKLTDDFYAMAEAAQYMTNQIPQFTDALGHYEDFYNNISAAYAAGEISQADYVDGLKESYSSILDYLTQLNELDKEMMHYYEDTLSAASDELDKYTDKLDYATDVLDHYKNIIELVNGEQDYDRIDTVLRGQAKTVGNSLEVALEEQAMLQRERDAILQEIANAPDEAARELLQNELDAVDSRLMEVGEEVYSYGEQQAEIWADILANSMEKAAHAMEQAFTDGIGFDFLNDSLDRLSSYADEYLTKTNQIYETQTLMNKAQEAADKTNNEAAKQRLNNFIQETQELQEKNQLSNLELEIQQAKYDLLLAEIALEEAQRAKSTVRLERDSEGNYGYVYTADQENVSAAEQDLLDAQNRLYNIGLEGTNEYGQKLIELTQELEENLKALNEAYMIDKTIDEEQYNAQRQQLLEEYYQLAEAYSNNYTTAMEVDTAIQEEAWVNAYDNIIGKTDEWESVTEEYLDACNNAYNEWQNEVVNENEIVQEAMNDTKASVDAVTEASDDLKNKVVNEVVPAIEKELGSVRAITNAYAQQRSAIQELISYYEKLVDQIYAAIAAETARANAQAQQEDDFDFNVDYSDLMDKAQQEEDWDAYWDYYEKRNYKIEHGYKDVAGVSTEKLHEYFMQNGDLNGQYVTDIEWFKQHGTGFATGGYTGEWGGSGRLALLHEKELVLNEDDTANFLVATGILRSLSSMIDLNALSNSLGSFTNQLTMAVSGSHDTIEQQVHIEASFPSVTDHNEIELALSNLVNTASQFANRKSL